MAELAVRGLVVDRPRPGRAGAATRALDGIDLVVRPGELVAVMGEAGAGKSTLALALAGALEPSSGSVARSGAVRLVLQRPESSFLEERVIDEVSLAPRLGGVPEVAARERALAALAALGLPVDLAERDPLALSGGEQRRVAIAAVLADDPAVLVLDEPAAGLDASARAGLHAALLRLHAAGRTIVLITHDPGEASRLATRLVVLRAGRVVWDGATMPVLGDRTRALGLGLDVAPEVQVLHAVTSARGIELPRLPTSPEDALALLAALPGPRDVGDATMPAGAAAARGDAPTPRAARAALPPPLPPLVDARVRLFACALTVAAALAAETVAGAATVSVAAAAVVAIARIDRARVRIAVRPLLALAVLLVALQLLVGGATSVELVRGIASDMPALAALHRVLQAAGVVLATLALSGATASTDLAAALRWTLAPLRALRVPVGSLAFVVATGLGMVPVLADELERLRTAQHARGLRSQGRSPLRSLRDDSRLLVPLFVAAFRRAHLLADALAVRGVDPRARGRSWRPRELPPGDLLLLFGGAALVVVARFA